MVNLGEITVDMDEEQIIALVESAPLVSDGQSGLVNIRDKQLYVWNFGNAKYGCSLVNLANSGLYLRSSTDVARYLEASAKIGT